jgi:gamma-glutamylcyclotransferase (GGCT)/AIG2-like uncharacterized protein YtfP
MLLNSVAVKAVPENLPPIAKYEARMFVGGVHFCIDTKLMRSNALHSDHCNEDLCNSLEDYSREQMFALGALFATINSGEQVVWGALAARRLNRVLDHVEQLLQQEDRMQDGMYRHWLVGQGEQNAEDEAA